MFKRVANINNALLILQIRCKYLKYRKTSNKRQGGNNIYMYFKRALDPAAIRGKRLLQAYY